MNLTRSPRKLAKRGDVDVSRVEDVAVRSANRVLVKLRQSAIRSLRSYTPFTARPIVTNELAPVLAKASAIMHAVGERRSVLMLKQQVPAAERRQKLADARDPWSLDAYGDISRLVAKHVQPNMDLIQQQYGGAVGAMLDDFASDIDAKIRAKLDELVIGGAPTKDAVAELQDYLDEIGVSGVGSGRLETIFRTQLQSSYSAGRWVADQDPDIQEILWGYKYVTAGDDRVRETHAELDGVTLPKDHPFWQTFWPPNGYNCRCQVIPLFDPREIVEPPSGIVPEPGFGQNAGVIVGLLPSLKLSRPRFKLSYNPDEPRDEKGEWTSGGPSGATTHVKDLGGSTGAKLVVDSKGKQWVQKTGASEAHAINEKNANVIYHAMGVRVPESHMADGKLHTEFVKGMTLDTLSGETLAKAEAKIRDHFVADAVMANWDVVGKDADNIVIDTKGKVWRVDNGGALEYRAMGTPKGAAFNGKLDELDSMRSAKNKGGEIFKHVSDADIIKQGKALLEKRDKIIAATPPGMQSIMKQRLDVLAKRINAPAPAAKPSGFHGKSLEEKITHLQPLAKSAKLNPIQVKKVALLNDDPSKVVIPKSFKPDQIDAVKNHLGPDKPVSLVVASKALEGKMKELGVANAHELWHGAKVTKEEKAIAVKQATTSKEKSAAKSLVVGPASKSTFNPGSAYANDPKFKREKIETGGVIKTTLSKGNFSAEDVAVASKKLNNYDENAWSQLDKWTSNSSWMREKEVKSPEHADVKQFNKALDAMPKFEGVTFRGVTHIKPGTEFYEALSKEGSIVEFAASACSSRATKIAAGFAGQTCLLRIAGKSGAAIESGGFGFDYEREVVIRKGTKFKVVGVAKNVGITESGTHKKTVALFVDLEEVASDTKVEHAHAFSWTYELSKTENRETRFTETDPETYMRVTWSREELFGDEKVL
jgi:SPP1 gp7 family putative phage head morphogenesis protein